MRKIFSLFTAIILAVMTAIPCSAKSVTVSIFPICKPPHSPSRRLSEKIGTRPKRLNTHVTASEYPYSLGRAYSPLYGKPFWGYPLTFTPLTTPPHVLAIFMRTSQRLHASLKRL